MRKDSDYYGTSTPKVEHIELPDVRFKRRLAVVIILALIAVGAVGYIIWGFLTVEPGWQTVSSDGRESCADDFVLQYEFRDGETSLYKPLSKLYTEAAEEAYKLFSSHKSFEGMNNLHVLNLRPNEELTLQSELYAALELLETSETRLHYLAPIYREYSSLFNSEFDYEAKQIDPDRSPEQAEYIDSLLGFILDENSIKLELLDDSNVKLCVSDEYLAFAKEYALTDFVSLYWLENAFMIDYIAEKLSVAGYRNGILTSFDGYCRSLGDAKPTYRIYDRVGNTVTSAAILTLEVGSRLVNLRDFPINLHDNRYFYEYADGEIVTRYIDSDGRDRTSVHVLTAYSDSRSCAELALELFPIYIDENFEPEKLASDRRLGLLYCENRTIITQNDLCAPEFTEIADGYTVK